MLSNALQQLDLKTLTGLLYLLEERHVGRAAARLNLSQSAMSRLLNRLREAFDDPLFIRTAQAMVPTAKAMTLETPIRQMLQKIASLDESYAFSPHSSERVFRLQTTHYQAQAYVPAIAERFYQAAPHAILETSTLTEASLLSPAQPRVDVVLCSEYVQVPTYFETKLLGYETFRCLMAKDHPLARQDSISMDDYLAYSHILVTMGGSGWVISDSVLGERAQERRFALRTPYFLAALETVGRTQLLMSTSGLLPERFQEQFGLVMKPLPVAFPDIRYFIGWSKFVSQDPAATWFRQLVREVATSLIPYPESVRDGGEI
ncbi:Nodulation protein D 2 [Marinomonas spartinae]|uniref:LysR family transcriptional regulator n=1 Tax=Marinomonas spartinae TaxID=1792290 RepID=UPI000808EF9F|nr:LysR family transcriptional regulator [Marinomonas spartinae]SBS39114.1 Nodulation protein D 2 [Marinomonas spartinae]